MLFGGEGKKSDKRTNASRWVGRKRDERSNGRTHIGGWVEKVTNGLTDERTVTKNGDRHTESYFL